MNFLTAEQIARMLEANELPYWRVYHYTKNAKNTGYEATEQLAGRVPTRSSTTGIQEPLDLESAVQAFLEWAYSVGTGTYMVKAQQSINNANSAMTFYLRLSPTAARPIAAINGVNSGNDKAYELLNKRLEALDAENYALREQLSQLKQEARDKEIDAKIAGLQEALAEEKSASNKLYAMFEQVAAIGLPLLMQQFNKTETPKNDMNTRPKQTPQPQDANINGIENAEYQDIEFDGELTDAEADVIHSEMAALVMKGGPTRTINILRRLTALSEQGLENVEVLLTKASEDKIALALKFV